MWEDQDLVEATRSPNRARIDLRQYLHTHDGGALMMPEKRLMLVMLEDALKCLSNYAEAKNKRSRRVFEQAEQWVFAGENHGVFSFENVCETLGLNPAYIRKGLKRSANAQTARPGQRSTHE